MHCYRMLGSFQDAEDALQDSLLAAWRGLDSFQGRASLRTWLYTIATNRCLNARRSAARRRAHEWDVPGVVAAGADPARRGRLARAAARRAGRGRRRRTARAGGPLRADRVGHPRLRDRAPGAAARGRSRSSCCATSSGSRRRRRPRCWTRPSSRSPARSSGRARASTVGAWRSRIANPRRAPRSPAEDALLARFVTRLPGRRPRRRGRPADRRRLHLDAADAVRVRGPRRRGRLLHPHLRRGPPLRPRPHPRERPAGVRRLPARPATAAATASASSC